MLNFLRLSTNKVLDFFNKYEKLIIGLAAIAAVVSLFMTFHQIRKAGKNIRAGYSYQIHKEGREIRISIKYEIGEIIRSYDDKKKYSEDKLIEAQSKIIEMLMFYVSVFRQWQYGNLESEEWNVISNEFCDFLSRNKLVEIIWRKDIANNKSWSEEFRKLGNQCLNKKKE